MNGRAVMAAATDAAPRSERNFDRIAFVVLVAAGATVPLWTQDAPFVLVLAAHAAIAAIVALSLDLLMGNTGLLSFGHAAWYGFGAYLAGILSISLSPEFLLVLPIVLAATVVAAAAVGAVMVRQIGKTFAILTLAFSQILYSLVFVLGHWTGGEDGLQGIPVVTVFGQRIISTQAWYWLIYGVLVVALLAAFHLRRTPLGKAWLAIRENTDRARFIGINTIRLKLISYVISAVLASVAGSLFVLFNGAVAPDVINWFESGKILMYVVLGGVGTIAGPAIGAAVFTFAEHYVSSFTQSWLIYFGGLFVIIVILAPGGLFGIFRKLWAAAAIWQGGAR